MRPYISFIVFITIVATQASGQNFNQKKQAYVDQKGENELMIPMPFDQSFFINPEVIQQLNGKKIDRIELVYTANKLNPSFDQQRLNDSRMKEFTKMYPKLLADNPTVTYVEQNGATSREEAKGMFHGFIVHYITPEVSLKKALIDKSNPPQIFTIDNSTGGDFTHTSGSIVHVPANCVVHHDGSPVIGFYTISYTEYRNAAQIAFSDIPMTFDEAGNHFQFNSVGMYELRGSQNGNDLQLTQPIVVDFNCTQVAENVDFYELNDNSGKWKKNQPVQFNKLIPQQQNVAIQPIMNKFPFQHFGRGLKSRRLLDPAEWKKYDSLKKVKPDMIKLAVRKEVKKRHMVRINRRQLMEFNKYLPEAQFNRFNDFNNGDFTQSTLLGGSNSSDPGHTYPALVRGLNSPSFGVFNCDQIFRIGDQLSLSPTYIDGETGKEIAGAKVACVINLKMNGSFSFDPKNIRYNPEAQNVILLFASDNRIYALSAKQLNELSNPSGESTLNMTNITAAVKTSDDLKNYLGL